MKNKAISVLFCTVFFAVCLMMLLLMPFNKSSISENRNLSQMPVIKTEEGVLNTNYFNELTTFIAEHFTGRSQFIEVNNTLKYYLFKTAGDDQVVIGKDGWLFFDETLEDYTGVTLSEEELEQIADNLKNVQDYIISLGKTPVIMIVPNKNSIYSEYMPNRFGEKSKVTNLSLLQELLYEKKVNYLDVQQILLDNKSMDELYLHKDTHWNNTGARLVLNNLYEGLGLGFSYDLKNYTIEQNHKSDLSEIIFPTKNVEENQRVYETVGNYEFTTRMRSLDDLNISTVNNNGIGKSILIYRDSFGRAMVDYVAQVFDETTFNRSTPYDLSLIQGTDCDYVIIEIVERNIKDLGDIIIPE